jgi:hypothetical protein
LAAEVLPLKSAIKTSPLWLVRLNATAPETHFILH